MRPTRPKPAGYALIMKLFTTLRKCVFTDGQCGMKEVWKLFSRIGTISRLASLPSDWEIVSWTFKLFSLPSTKHFPVEQLSAEQLPVNIQPLLARYIHAGRNNTSPLTIKQSKIICSRAYNNGYWPNQKAHPPSLHFKIVPASLPSDREVSCSGSQTNTTRMHST